MKMLISTILLIILMAQGSAYAHQGHDEVTVINSEIAVDIASDSVKKLTFKDFGYAVGKLDASWKSLNVSDFNVLQVLDKTFIVSATNSTKEQIIYFEIAINGQVLSVKDTQ